MTAGNDKSGKKISRAERIAAARSELTRRRAADPAGFEKANLRLMRVDAARKRERQRFETRVLGNPPPPPAMPSKPKGMPTRVWRKELARFTALAISEQSLAAKWSHKQGTPETLENAANTHDGALAQLHANGVIDSEQLEWTAQIANVHRSIEADVAVAVASLEARVDQAVRAGSVGERIHRVRMHHAYGIWRAMLPAPKALALDMIVGDAIGYTVAARRHRVHNRKAKRVLLEAIQRWPLCVAAAFSAVDPEMVDAMNRAEAPYRRTAHPFGNASEPSYEQVRRYEAGRERTDEPYLLPPVDPAFLDDNGYLRPWAQIADIVREKVAAAVE